MTTKKISVDALLGDFKKEYGQGIGGRGLVLPQVHRCPSGIFAFDIATGGGIPLNRLSIFYGTESSGKTNLALCCIREFQIRWPDKVCVFIDMEGTLTTDWAEKLGVDTAKLVIIRPDYAEQVVDVVEKLMYAEDIGLIVIDSIAAMATMQELDSSAEKANVGGSGLACGKLVRKTTLAMKRATDAGGIPTMIWINQIRYKIGVVFGNPETMPGGEAQKFMAALRVRLHGKNEMNAKVSKAMPSVKLTKGVIQKWKHPIVGVQFEYRMAMIQNGDILPGRCNDWPTVKNYTSALGWLTEVQGGWEYVDPITGEELTMPTQKALWEVLRQPQWIDNCRRGILTELMTSSTVQKLNEEGGDENEQSMGEVGDEIPED